MKVHYHGVHECHGGAEHVRLLADEGRSGAGLGEAFGLRGGPLGLASGGRRLIHHVAEEEGV